MDYLKEKENETSPQITYEDKAKDRKSRNSIIKKWRSLGLLDGIQQNSKPEKLIVEMYERMAIFLVYGNVALNETFGVSIFPTIKLLYTGEKFTGKKINFIVKPEELIEAFSFMTLNTCEAILQENTPKSISVKVQPLFNLISYKNLGNKTLMSLSEDDFSLSEDEISLLTALIPNSSKTRFDFEAEVLSVISSCCVFVLKNGKKTAKLLS